jgi:hypothetical protein
MRCVKFTLKASKKKVNDSPSNKNLTLKSNKNLTPKNQTNRKLRTTKGLIGV